MSKQKQLSWLLVDVIQDDGKNCEVQSELFDGTKFRIFVPRFRVDYIPEPIKPNQAWIEVVDNGEHNNRVAITLPTPNITMGHEITVKSQMLRRGING